MEMNFRQCPRCKKVKHWHQFYNSKDQYRARKNAKSQSFGLTYGCKICMNISVKKRINDPKKRKHDNIKSLAYYYKEDGKKRASVRAKKYRDELHSNYILIQLNKGLSGKNRIRKNDVSYQLIEAKRQQILLHRKLKEARNEFN